MALVFGQALFHDRVKPVDRSAAQKQQMTIDAPLQAVLVKKDDRLLLDAGLTRDDVLGLDGLARAEWARNRLLWNL